MNFGPSFSLVPASLPTMSSIHTSSNWIYMLNRLLGITAIPYELWGKSNFTVNLFFDQLLLYDEKVIISITCSQCGVTTQLVVYLHRGQVIWKNCHGFSSSCLKYGFELFADVRQSTQCFPHTYLYMSMSESVWHQVGKRIILDKLHPKLHI